MILFHVNTVFAWFKYTENSDEVSEEKMYSQHWQSKLARSNIVSLQNPVSPYLTEYSVQTRSYADYPYIKVPLVHCQSGNHGSHAVAPKAVPQHRSQHGVPVRNMGAVLLWQSYDHLKKRAVKRCWCIKQDRDGGSKWMSDCNIMSERKCKWNSVDWTNKVESAEYTVFFLMVERIKLAVPIQRTKKMYCMQIYIKYTINIKTHNMLF